MTETIDKINKDKYIVKHRLPPHAKRLYYIQKLCKGKNKSNEPCRAIAIIGSDYCRFHSKLPSIKRLTKDLEARPERYQIPITFQKYLYRKNLADQHIFNLSDEIALLQTHLQVLINKNFELSKNNKNIDDNIVLQLSVIEHLRKLTETLKRIEVQEKYFDRANQTIKVVLQRIVVIIEKFITDKDIKRLIAQELYKLGLETEGMQQETIDKNKAELKEALNIDKKEEVNARKSWSDDKECITEKTSNVNKSEDKKNYPEGKIQINSEVEKINERGGATVITEDLTANIPS